MKNIESVRNFTSLRPMYFTTHVVSINYNIGTPLQQQHEHVPFFVAALCLTFYGDFDPSIGFSSSKPSHCKMVGWMCRKNSHLKKCFDIVLHYQVAAFWNFKCLYLKEEVLFVVDNWFFSDPVTCVKNHVLISSPNRVYELLSSGP